jgi:hypothetical protein
VTSAVDAKEAARRLRRMAGESERQIVRGIRRGQTRFRTAIIEKFRATGVGRTIFGELNPELMKRKNWKTIANAGARAFVKRERVRKIGSVYSAGMVLRGLAALTEAGGKTRPHKIHALGAVERKSLAEGRTPAMGMRYLQFQVRGKWRRPLSVNHPGSRMPKQPFAAAAARTAEPAFAVEMKKALAAAAEVAGVSTAAQLLAAQLGGR